MFGRVPTGTAPKPAFSCGRSYAGNPSRSLNALSVVACAVTKLAEVEKPSAAASPIVLLTVGP
ncbi:MAG: hypothetical protein DMF88_14915 [Acidobacteria bacterium]|nr:MAG: hypothetical protein DMF88_14915 [Acidobacteriota bacterium]